ncbi:facilitated trehalose transporter Tret1-2 homolog isoform X1 [Amphibalanus amphitrite]|uniref:facilitated trehalose transporter Tret1-2 homolog isoform X1 n=2 Tax=Amphibalanus amphitrite TaxID=1232801 RepID=UPI001C9264C7|nr:facilitated trehalose transporter Tret1-2 homolog isoform X1 [Amphibalanus amphitrite]
MEKSAHTVIDVAGYLGTIQLRQWPQYVGTLLAGLTQLEIGIVMAFSAVLLPQLEADGVEVSPEHQSLLVSITTAGIVLGCSLSTVLLRYMGPRRLMMLHGPPAAASWLLVAAASDVRLVIAGRLLVSFFNAVTLPCYQAYICDVAVPRLRGRLSATPEVLCSLGVLIGYGVGSAVHWTHMAAILGVLPNVLIFAGFLWLPESPSWLTAQLQFDEAAEAGRFYKGDDYPVEREIEAAARRAEKSERVTVRDVLRKMAHRETLLPILLVTGLFVFQILSGMLAVLSYVVTIFQMAGTSLDEYMCAVIIGVTRLTANVLASGFADRFGRRTLLIGSSLMSALSLATLGAYFWAQQRGQLASADSLGWVPVTALILYMAAANFGIGPVTWMAMGELVPASVSSVANGAILLVWGAVYFGVLQAFPYLTRWLGAHGTFWAFAACCAALAAFTALLLPETRGLELHQVETLFARRPPTDASQDKKADDLRDVRPRRQPLPVQRNALQLDRQQVQELRQVRRRTESCTAEFRTPAAN